MRIVFDPAWQSHVYAATDALFRDRLGPDIRADAWRRCPKQSGDLADSLEWHIEGHRLVISASGSDERSYCTYVEFGHRIVAFGHPTGRVQPPNPFMRSALYTERAA